VHAGTVPAGGTGHMQKRRSLQHRCLTKTQKAIKLATTARKRFNSTIYSNNFSSVYLTPKTVAGSEMYTVCFKIYIYFVCVTSNVMMMILMNIGV